MNLIRRKHEQYVNKSIIYTIVEAIMKSRITVYWWERSSFLVQNNGVLVGKIRLLGPE